ncbi:MAG TPA: hypothetical protein VGO53_12555, partial [Steroidobacteraceae bacterium]|nr:hypothetical protein [Steroidobacteraceae bacterium]
MRAGLRFAALAGVAAVAQCLASSSTATAAEASQPGVDYHSFANVAEFRVRNVDLDLAVDFAARRLVGHTDLTVARLKKDAHTLVLDTRDLDIRSVSLLKSGAAATPLTYALGEAQPFLGKPLRIEMPPVAASADVIVRIVYQTEPQASGLQWLTPAQTAGKKHPYLFSQNESI